MALEELESRSLLEPFLILKTAFVCRNTSFIFNSGRVKSVLPKLQDGGNSSYDSICSILLSNGGEKHVVKEVWLLFFLPILQKRGGEGRRTRERLISAKPPSYD